MQVSHMIDRVATGAARLVLTSLSCLSLLAFTLAWSSAVVKYWATRICELAAGTHSTANATALRSVDLRSRISIGLGSVLFLVMTGSLHGQDSSTRDLIELISSKQQLLIDSLSRSISVDTNRESIYGVKTKSIARPTSYRTFIQGQCVLIKEGNEVMGKNRDYFFAVSRLKPGDRYSLVFLESDEQNADALERQATAYQTVFESVYFFQMSLPDVFRCESFRLQSAYEVDGVARVKFDFTHPVQKTIFRDVELELDAANGYQLKRAKFQYGDSPPVDGVTIYEYENKQFDGTDVGRLKYLKTIDSYKPTNSSSIDEDHYISTYSNWSQSSIDESLFSLSGYGLPEPRLDDWSNWLRWAIILLVGIFGLVALLMGNRLFVRSMG